MGSMEINSSNIRSLPKPSFIDDLAVETEVSIPGIETRCYLLNFCQDEAALDAWALHIRRHYVRDDVLKKNCVFRDVTTERGMLTIFRTKYLCSKAQGPSVLQRAQTAQ